MDLEKCCLRWIQVETMELTRNIHKIKEELNMVKTKQKEKPLCAAKEDTDFFI